MENRQPTVNNSPKPFNRNKNFRNEGERPFGRPNYQPRDNSFQPRNDRYQSRDNRTQSRDNNFQNRDNNYQNRDNQNQGRENGFQARDNRNQGRDNGYQSRDNRFQGRNDRFKPSNGKFQPRDNRFQSKDRFAGKGKGLKPWEKDTRPRIVSEMQVTDGKHRGKHLQATASEKVRPTARRIREVMFRILYRRIRAGRFLDLCAGGGTVGIEAISRGALLGTFVERSAKMCAVIKKNLETCEIKEGHGEIHQIEVIPFLKKMGKRRRFWDVVYYDPPYDSNYEEVLAYFSRGIAVKPHGTLVIEHHAEMFFPENIGVMKRWRVVVQGETALSFYERR
jgi:16S rRNA (guanine(966)-N(2))-methyltransferase RsmD